MALRFESVRQAVALYLAGYYPFDHPNPEQIYWHRETERPILLLDPETVGKAVRMRKRIRTPFELRENTAFDQVLALLGHEQIKRRSWVRGGVVAMYRQLHAHGMARSTEAWLEGELVGGLITLEFRNIAMAETMFLLVPDASKACLCHAVERYAARGFPFLDVQMAHPEDHPASRLGERILPIEEYVELVRTTLVEEWPGLR